MAINKLIEGDLNFVGGMNSSLAPDLLPSGFFARSENTVLRGGFPSCRPGYRTLAALPPGRIQGATVFRPKIGSPALVFAVEGSIYISEAPFKTFRQLISLSFSPTAAQVFFKQAEKSIEFNADGSLSFVPPKNILVIQDGAQTPAAVFDGTNATHQIGDGVIPMGGPMEWIGDRLWVARDANLYASDIANPTSFVEDQYIASPRNFVLPSRITALVKSPSSASSDQLIAFTETTTSAFQVGVRDRSLWSATPGFQKEILPNIGCVAARSVRAHYGQLYWYSAFGLVSLDSAAQAYISSALPYVDAEMEGSKSRLSQDLSGIACVSHENFFLASVPHSSLFNTHTWVQDNTVLASGKQPTSAWCSVWTGTRPVEWLAGTFDGHNRVFFLSADYDGENRLWEAFTPDRTDNGCPITWWVETRALSMSLVGKLKEMRYADVFLSELSGQVDLAVFWAGGFRGKYKRILTQRINASRGSLRSGETLTATSKIFALKKQSRSLRTQDGKALASQETLGSCDVESPNLDFKDTTFQLLIVGSGPGALRGYNVYSEVPVNDDDAGRVEKDENEENFVRFDGAATENQEFSEALAEFNADLPEFTSTMVSSLTQKGFTEIASGTARSLISQDDADKIAEAIAKRTAAVALEAVVPSVVSKGASANE